MGLIIGLQWSRSQVVAVAFNLKVKNRTIVRHLIKYFKCSNYVLSQDYKKLQEKNSPLLIANHIIIKPTIL